MKAEKKAIKHFYFEEEKEKVYEIDYVVIPLLPADQQEPFNKWLFGQTCPLIPEEKYYQLQCAYYWDYEGWYDYWIKDQEAPVYD